MTDKKKVEIVFAPGCFDNFDGTQEELDAMMAEIQQLVDSGEIFEKAVPVDIDELMDEMDFTEDDFEMLLDRKLH